MLNDRNYVTVRQDLPEIKQEIHNFRGKNAAFQDWLNKLSSTDQLPRGRFFKGKKGGRPRFIFDEAWQFLKQN
jgi:hypothetical protein